MKTLIVSSSRSAHANTRRIANAMADVLEACVISPAEAVSDRLLQADRVGFGSGIYNQSFDRALLACVDRLPNMSGRQAFIFSTSGLREMPLRRYTRGFVRQLEKNGFTVTGAFACRGLDDWGPFRLVGGVSKGHPNAHDLEQARRFAAQLPD